MLFESVADGVHRIEDANTNWYLAEDDSGVTVVDCGVPGSWDSLMDALPRIGRTPRDVRAVVLTHAHFDHVGFAERARTELGVPVYVHENDVPLTRHLWRYDHERPRAAYLATQVRALPIVATFLRERAARLRSASTVASRATIRGPVRAVYGSSVTTAPARGSC
jgi:glyoxylase-like metal-dependent hydrolase (beta-lactamase superfamily II)